MVSFKIATAAELDKYSEQKGIFFQTSSWAEFKSAYGKEYFIGQNENGETVLSCLLFLIRIPFTKWKIGYAMRGPVCDLSDSELVKGFTAFLHDYMKKNHVIYSCIDPYYAYKTDFIITESGEKAFQNLSQNGYLFNPDKAHSIQRMTNYRIQWNADQSPEELENKVFNLMEKKLKNDILIAQERGLEPVSFSGDEITEDVFESFYSLLVTTSEMKEFSIRSRKYYEELFRYMKKYITVYFYRYNADKDLAYTNAILEKVSKELNELRIELSDPNTTPQKKERLLPKEKELLKQLNATVARKEITISCKDAGYLSTYLCIRLGEKAHDFYGANSPKLRDLRLTSNYWAMLKDSFRAGCVSFDMGGTLRLDTEDIKQDKTYDLYQYKSRYNGNLDEMIGEFRLIENPVLYRLFDEKLHYLRRVLFRK